MSDAAGSAAGFCGKLPIRSDFVTRRVPLAFVEPWHDWLAASLAGMRDALGEDWLNAYLYGPIWRFALPSGTVGAAGMAGILMPSVDAVGRYFPLTIALSLPGTGGLAAAVTDGAAWFAEAEGLALAALDGTVDLDELSDRLLDLALPAAVAPNGSQRATPALPEPGLVIAVDAEPDALTSALAAEAPSQLAAGNTVWWTEGAEAIGAAALLARGLPGAAAFGAMFTGDWVSGGWQMGAADAPVAAPGR